MKHVKKVLVIVFVVVFSILLSSIVSAEEIGIDPANPLAIDLIVVMDNSWSLKNGDSPSDPDGYRFDATAAVVNMLDSAYSKANYVLFNEDVNVYSNGKLTQLTEKNGLSLLDVSMSLGRTVRMQMLNDLTSERRARHSSSSGGSDIGKALLTAVDTMLLDRSGNKKVIILLIDGDVSFSSGDRSDGKIQRLKNTSYENIAAARSKAEENGITIHTVLLNNSSIADFAQKELCTSDGTFLLVTDPEQLPRDFSKMLSANIGSTVLAANGLANNAGEISIPVPNSSVAELNIAVPVSHLKTASLQLVSPEGTIMSGESDSCYSFVSPNYAIYKVISPQTGDWKLQFQGDGTGKNITALYVLGYDIVLSSSTSTDIAGKSEPVTVNSSFVKNGVAAHDSSLYQIPATVTLLKDGIPLKSDKVTGTEDGYTYTFESLKEYGAGEYSASFSYDGQGLTRTAPDANFTIAGIAPALKPGVNGRETYSFTINIPGVETSYDVQSNSWDLESMVYDPDEDDLNWTITSSPEGVVSYMTGSTLTVSTIQNTTAAGDIIVSVTDSDGLEGPSLLFGIDVTSEADAVDTIVYGPENALTKANDSALIRVQYSIDGTTLTVGDYYNIPATLTLKRGNAILLSGQSMDYDGSAYSYTLNGLKKYGPGEFEVDVRLQSGSFQLDCTPCIFSLENMAPVMCEDVPAEDERTIIINDPENQDTYQGKKETIDLSSYAYDPDGDDVVWSIMSNTADVKTSWTGSTLTITTKLNTETTGDIVVAAKDTEGDTGAEITFHISVRSLEKEFGIRVSGPTKAVEKNDTVPITAKIMQNGIPVARDSGLNSFPATLALKKGDEVIYSAKEMTYKNGAYTCELPDLAEDGSGEYSVIVTVSEGKFHMESEPFAFTLTNSAPVLSEGAKSAVSYVFRINDPEDEKSYDEQEWTYDLSQQVFDPNGDPLTFAVDSNAAEVKAEITGSSLTITTIEGKTTSGDIVITVTDPEGASGPDLTFRVSVESVEDELGISVTVPGKPVPKESSVTVKARITQNGIAVARDSGLNSFPATLALKKGDEVIEPALTMTCENGEYTCELPDLAEDGSGEYSVVVTVSEGKFRMESKPFAFTLTNSAPVLSEGAKAAVPCDIRINDPEDEKSYDEQEWTYDLSRQVFDPNGDPLTFAVDSNVAEVKAEITGSSLTITTIEGKTTSGDIVITVTDSEGAAGPDLTFRVSVKSVEDELGISVTVPGKPEPKQSPVTVEARLTQNGKVLAKDSKLKNIPAALTLIKGEETILSESPMTCEDGVYSCVLSELAQYGAGEYRVIVTFAEGNFKLPSDEYTFTLTNSAPVFADKNKNSASHKFEINIPGNEDSYKPESWNVDLDQCVIDPNDDMLSWEIVSKPDKLTVLIEQNELKVFTLQNQPTEGDIVVVAHDPEGKSSPEFHIGITVVSIEDVYEKYTASFVPVGSNQKNSDISISLQIFDENNAMVMNDTYLPSEIEVTVSDGENSTPVQLLRADDGSYSGTFRSGPLSTECSVNTEVYVGEKCIKSDTAEFATVNNAPVLSGDLPAEIPQTVLLLFGYDKDVDLNRFFSDPDGDVLTYSVTDNTLDDHAELSVNGSTLCLKAMSGSFFLPYTGSFTITATDNEGAQVISGIVTITIWPLLWILLIAVAVIVLIFIVIKILLWKNAHFGNVAFDVSYGYKGLELPDGLSSPLPSGSHSPVELAKYCTDQARSVVQSAFPDSELAKIALIPLAKDNIRVSVAENAAVSLYEAHPVFNDGAYSSDKVIRKGHVLKLNESIALVSGEYMLCFKLVRVTKRKASSDE